MADPQKPPDLKWLIASGVALLGFAALLIATADRIAFLSRAAYFLLLVPTALGVAFVLFRVLRSSARYRGRVLKGRLELSGPIVGFAGVMLAGMWLGDPATTSSLTVRLSGPEGRGDLITEGEVILDLGDDRRTKGVGPDGQVVFSQIPVQFLSGRVEVTPRIDRYRARTPGPYPISPGRVVEVELERIPDSTAVAGTVFDARGPVVDALVNIDHGRWTGRTDANGNFRLVLPVAEGTTLPVAITLEGRTLYDDRFVVSDAVGLRVLVERGER